MDVNNVMQLTTGIADIKTTNFDKNNFLSLLTIALEKKKQNKSYYRVQPHITRTIFIKKQP
jgi:hypothetical protein